MIRFSVDSIVVTDLGVEVQGRVADGDISIGTRFTSLQQDGSEDVDDVGLTLVVARILCYQRSIAILPRGMTGQLLVEGNGLEHLLQSSLPATLGHDA